MGEPRSSVLVTPLVGEEGGAHTRAACSPHRASDHRAPLPLWAGSGLMSEARGVRTLEGGTGGHSLAYRGSSVSGQWDCHWNCSPVWPNYLIFLIGN